MARSAIRVSSSQPEELAAAALAPAPAGGGGGCLRVAALAASPLVTPDGRPLAQLRVADEVRRLDQAVRSCGRRVRWRAAVATPAELLETLAEATVLVLSAHGTLAAEGGCGLILEDVGAGGTTTIVSAAEMQRGVAHASSRPAVVVLSACHSEACAAAFEAIGVPHVVVVRRAEEVSDGAAAAFSEAFLRALLKGTAVGTAFGLAVATVSLQGGGRVEVSAVAVAVAVSATAPTPLAPAVPTTAPTPPIP